MKEYGRPPKTLPRSPGHYQEFVEAAFSIVGLDHRKYVRSDPQLFRPSEKVRLCGDPARARSVLGWKPTLAFKDIVRTMVENEMKLHETP